MRTLSPAMTRIIADADFTGPNAAVARVTIYDDPFLGIYPVNDWSVNRTGSVKVQQVFSSLPFRQVEVHGRELPNIKSIDWERSTDGDIATCTLELWNTKPLPPGTGPDLGGGFDLLGHYTYNRGRTSYSQTTWGHAANEWRDTLVPDSMIITYQGYGEANYTLLPEDDDVLVQTGVWLVDEVTYTADGLITMTCRDAARLLADQISFPPVVPFPLYPQRYESYHPFPLPPVTNTITTGIIHPKYDTSGNFVYIGDAPVAGHHGVDGFDEGRGSASTYWLSTGNARPDQGYSYEWCQGRLAPTTLNSFEFHVWGGPYKVWLSVYSNNAWVGAAIIPYDPNNPASGPNGSDIPYVQEGRVGRDGKIQFTVPGGIPNVTKVRITFTDLYNSGIGPFRYRAGLRQVHVSGTASSTVPGGIELRGNYGDYSDIIKLLLAWGGFYWPQDGAMYLTNSNTDIYSFSAHDTFLQQGRIWGDIQLAGVAGKVDLGMEIWDKKPLLECLGYIKDILGFIFFVDEQGAAQWRSPNTFRLGNWRSSVDGINLTRVLDYIQIRDDEAILGLRAVLSSRNLRDHVFVANLNGRIGAVSKGRLATGGFRRVGGWTDQNFLTVEECQTMADLITIRQLFTYRQNSVRIAANPAIQVDDQVEILERTTGEAYRHYVKSISSRWELETGVWAYDLTTSWLGEDPQGIWAFQTAGLADATIAYLTALGQI